MCSNGNVQTCEDRNCDPRPLVEYLCIRRHDMIQTHILECEVLCVLAGSLNLSYDNVGNLAADEGKMLLLPQNCHLRLTALADTKLLVLRMRYGMVFSECVSFEEMIDDIPRPERKLSAMETRPEVVEYIDNLVARIKDGIGNPCFLELKLKEYLFLLKNYYSREKLGDFFYPLMGSNSAFADFVTNNHRKVRTVIEFAGLANYSLSGFEKRFRRVFGVSPYRWMKEEKAKNILDDIRNGTKPFSQMKEEYGFSSMSHFNYFCKKSFGIPPGRLRRENRC